jgi:putative flavoprotein involved in K+ transport
MAVQEWLDALSRALSARDIEACSALFHPDAFWRDLVAFSWTIVTLDGREAIAAMLRKTLAHVQPSRWVMDGAATETGGTVEAWVRFDTAAGRGRGILRLRDGRAWTLFTALQELRGFEEPAGDRRPRGVVHAALRGRRTWAETRAAEAATLGISIQPYCLIVGGGQGGIGLAARLKRLEVPTLVIDRLERPGRRLAAALQEPVPARPGLVRPPALPALPDDWPVFAPKDKIGDWLEMYVQGDGAGLLEPDRVPGRQP